MLAGAKPSIDSSPSSHPRAFGRTSNVWQYLDGFQDRLTPPTTLGRSRSSRKSGQERGNHVESQLDPLGDDASDGIDDEDNKSEASRSASGHSQSGSAGPRRRHELGKGRSRHSVTFANGEDKRNAAARLRHASGSSLKNVVSLPELLAGGRATMKKSSLQSGAMTGNNASPSGSTSVPNETNPGSPIWRRDRKPPVTKARVSISEVMRTLNALGTSASEPALPGASPTPPPSQPTIPQQQLQTLPAGGATSPSISSAAILSVAITPAVATTAAAVVSDAEKLRNDFNSQRTRLSYGCSVALELFNGHVMMVGSPDGQVRVQSLEKLQALPQVKGYKDRAVFTLLDLSDPRSASSIRFGDAVWLQLSIGTGETSWEQGGVLGAKVREAPQLKALALSDGPDLFRNDAPAPAIVGHPVPIRAYLPKVMHVSRSRLLGRRV
jgi:hypothetical protein